jgi:hypothetical protein
VGALVLALAVVPASALAAAPLSWSSPAGVDTASTPGAVACPSEALCVAVDRSGRALFTRDPVAQSPSWSKPTQIGDGQPLVALACAPEGLCVAADEGGSVLASADPGAGAGSWVDTKIDGAALSGVSCPSASLCVAVDQAGNALVSTDPGSPAPTWVSADVDGSTALRGISCPSEALCLAVDTAGNALVSGSPASGGWHARTIDPSGSALVAVSCASSSLCVAIDVAGNALVSADAGAGTPTWSSTQVDLGAAPTALSCATSGLCVLLDSAGDALASDDPTAAVPVWSGSAAEQGAAMAAVSCLPAGVCTAFDSAGRALTGVVAAPLVSTAAATEVTATEATLTASVDPRDGTLSGCHFEFGPTPAYGSSVPCAGNPLPAGGAQTVQARVAGLAGSSGYHYRVVAMNIGGVGVGGDGTFTTAAPVSIVSPHPSILGVPGVGERLHCLPGVSSGFTATLTYAWVRDASLIAKASGSTYAVATADARHHLQCRVTATDAAGSATAGSAFVAVPATGVIAASGETSVGRIQAKGSAITIPLTCSTQARNGCGIAVQVTGTERRAGKHPRRIRVVLAGGSTRLKHGEKRTVSLRLNALGRRLLAHARRLTVRVAVSGTVIGTLSAKLASATLTLRYSPGRAARASRRARSGRSR